MNKFKEITDARKVLELSETASINEIKDNYRRLLSRWHPDKCLENKAECTEITQQLTSAYNILMRYCNNYKYSFTETTVNRHLSPKEWWADRFGNDPLWGKNTKPES